MKPGRMYLVEWVDSGVVRGWLDEGDLPALVACSTVGFLVHVDKARLVMASSTNSSDQAGQTLAIPRSSVQAVKRVR